MYNLPLTIRRYICGQLCMDMSLWGLLSWIINVNFINTDSKHGSQGQSTTCMNVAWYRYMKTPLHYNLHSYAPPWQHKAIVRIHTHVYTYDTVGTYVARPLCVHVCLMWSHCTVGMCMSLCMASDYVCSYSFLFTVDCWGCFTYTVAVIQLLWGAVLY